MYRNKREVDRFVTDLERTSKSDLERDLKGLTVAKLYFNIGEYQTALVFLDKYDSCRKNSAVSLKLRAQVGPVDSFASVQIYACETFWMLNLFGFK